SRRRHPRDGPSAAVPAKRGEAHPADQRANRPGVDRRGIQRHPLVQAASVTFRRRRYDRRMLSVRIRRLASSVSLPEYQSPGAAGFDLAASEDVSVQPGAVALVPTGLVVETPRGYFLGIFARSSTPLKRGLMVANGVGVVDADYCGQRDEV